MTLKRPSYVLAIHVAAGCWSLAPAAFMAAKEEDEPGSGSLLDELTPFEKNFVVKQRIVSSRRRDCHSAAPLSL